MLNQTGRILLRAWAGGDPVKVLAVQGVLVHGYSPAVVGPAVGVSERTVLRWVKDFRRVVEEVCQTEKIDAEELLDRAKVAEIVVP